MFAAKSSSASIAGVLLGAGAKVHLRATNNATGFAGLYPIHFAVAAVGVRGRAMEATLAALIRAGADVNVKDHDGWTPLHYAVVPPRGRVVSTLLAAGSAPNAMSPEGTPLTVLCRLANPRKSTWIGVATALRQAGADAFLTNRRSSEESPFSIAVAAWNDRLRRILQRAAG